jgi:quercetin dioxygenase-like cupin family protein
MPAGGGKRRPFARLGEPTMAFVCDIPAVPTVQPDDESIRITRWDFAPGAATGWHSHGWPYFVTMLTEGVLKIHNGKEISDVPLAAGQAYARPAGVTHDVMNGSDHPIAFVEIEVKRPDKLVQLSKS